ncbi:hypothetical protein DL766_004631 [Monosporascus sp. MC13-8B]|uniref:Beta-lactamase-related domain-containing protein n=1 Tax=Monosporascus cannonballus TaxID=155416 RepID=A0ABY0HFI8_9PEZI|nr:hypothetical protein DL763_007040 [Monosporascus cannonballus]RYO91465.1 hypothetical protein DL762_002191 [Monosporascus cannonballus]RYP30912.1 hypothetical protein DL766_004631 [Monosporascus sp. MC13-8B]
MFLSATVGILASEGRMSWDDPIQKYLPDFNPMNDPQVGTEATIRDALRHATGIGHGLRTDDAAHGYEKAKKDIWTKITADCFSDEHHSPVLSSFVIRSSVDGDLKRANTLLAAHGGDSDGNPLRGIQEIWKPRSMADSSLANSLADFATKVLIKLLFGLKTRGELLVSYNKRLISTSADSN